MAAFARWLRSDSLTLLIPSEVEESADAPVRGESKPVDLAFAVVALRLASTVHVKIAVAGESLRSCSAHSRRQAQS